MSRFTIPKILFRSLTKITPNYQLFKLFKRAYHLLDFQKTWVFHEYQSVVCVKPGFIQFKLRLFEMSMFRLNWLRRWESVYPNGCIPDSNHKFSSLRQLKNISLLHFSKIFRIQNAMHKRLKHKSIHFMYTFM